MKNKGILIAIAIVVVVALAGVFIFLYLKDPEILTRSPSEIISGGVIDEDKDQGEPSSIVDDLLNPKGDCLVVSSSNCDSASFLRWTDGKFYKNVILFPSISVGDKLYAPMSGYIRVSDVQGEFGHHTEISISTDWSESKPVGHYIVFAAQDFELLDIGLKDDHLYVEKGEAFAKVKESAELFPGTYEQKPELMTVFDKDWADTLDDSIEDPREYIKSAIENIN